MLEKEDSDQRHLIEFALIVISSSRKEVFVTFSRSRL